MLNVDFFNEWLNYFIDRLTQSLARNDRIIVRNFGTIPRESSAAIDYALTSARRNIVGIVGINPGNEVRINPRTGQRSIFAPIFPNLDQEANRVETATSLLSPALSEFIKFRRQVEEKNNILSQQYNPLDHKLRCPILLDFPLIPVRFNGRLYDYDQLMKLIHNDVITDPITREMIKLSPHVIQPDYDAQERMDILLNEMKKNQQRITMLN